MKVVIAGGRNFTDYKRLKTVCDFTLVNYTDIEIVSGGAEGADKLGEQYAKEKGYPIKRFPADWENLGRKAGPIRNKQMAEYADSLIAFWDGESRGTKSMIDFAVERKLKMRVIYY